MDSNLHKDIIGQIGSYLSIEDIVNRLGYLDKYISQSVKTIYWTHEIADLRYFSVSMLTHILSTYNFARIDLSNTMITDKFAGRLDNRSEIILHNCFNLTDLFVDKIPQCESLDLTNCVNVTGSFLESRPKWQRLKVSGCFFIKSDDLMLITKCAVLDLTQTIFPYEPTIWSELCGKCDEIFIDDDKSLVIPADIKNISKVKSTYEFPIPPDFKHICCDPVGASANSGAKAPSEHPADDQSQNVFGTYMSKSKILAKIYIYERYLYAKSIKKFAEAEYVGIQKYKVTEGFFNLLEGMTFISNVFKNQFFFRQKVPSGWTKSLENGIMKPITHSNMFEIENSDVTLLSDEYYYDNDVLDDMLQIKLLPLAFVNENVDYTKYQPDMTESYMYRQPFKEDVIGYKHKKY